MSYRFDVDDVSIGSAVAVLNANGDVLKIDKVKRITPKRKDVMLMNTDTTFDCAGIEKRDNPVYRIVLVTDEVRANINRHNLISEARRKLDNVKCFLVNNENTEVAQIVLRHCEVIRKELEILFHTSVTS